MCLLHYASDGEDVLRYKIDSLRSQLANAVSEYNSFTAGPVVQLSQALDIYILESQQKQSKKGRK
ncbi:aspartyl-phosphate phosphatase Spo0E family protein [Paenibacillus sp. 481]|uniref:aspartyl-phosphate phosphatase Spo0E family protein n=1 Tax=Paenibacillus sp. 481 TaxID=2835869 RepID=UPI003FA78F15|nr:aspartyl-phosphate phosphatase Spo0E family protein [Paenibacillus sp. 481]